jgi:hypothetical protein
LTELFNYHKNPSSFVVVDSDKDKELKKPTTGSVLGRFFVIIGVGGLFLSLGLIGLIKWMRGQPLLLPVGLAIASLVLGIAMDAWAIRYFWQRRQDIF